MPGSPCMMNIAPPLRPARTAIAAVLVLATTPLLAQTVPPPSEPVAPDAPPPVVATTPVAPVAAPAPVTAPPAVAPPVVATVAPSAPIAQEAAAPVSPSARDVAPAQSTPARAARAETPSAVASRAPAAERTASPFETPATPVASSPATPATAAPVGAETVPAPVATAPDEASIADPSDNGATAALVGGIVLLAGAGAIYALRRRKGEPEMTTAPVAPIIDPERVRAIDAPVEQAPTVAAVERPREIVGSQDRFAFNAVTPAASVAEKPAQSVTASNPVSATGGSVEDMIAAPPSRENPFLTRKNRLRRAGFLMRQNGAVDHAMASPASPGPAAGQGQDRAQVYNYGGKGSASPIGRPKPVFQ